MVFNGDVSQKLNSIVITSEDVMSKIINFKDDIKAPGNDGIIPEFLKHIVKEISEPLAIIYNKSLPEGVVLQERKRANIIYYYYY